MLERINDRLLAEGIPAVQMIILKWRVSQLLRDIQRKYGMWKRICVVGRAIVEWSMSVLCISRRLILYGCSEAGSMLNEMRRVTAQVLGRQYKLRVSKPSRMVAYSLQAHSSRDIHRVRSAHMTRFGMCKSFKNRRRIFVNTASRSIIQ